MINEKELLYKIKNGDDNAFEELVKEYQQKICNTIFYMVKNEDIVEDLAQEVFIKIYKNISKFNEDSSLYTWIYRITMNTCIDQIKKERKIVYINTSVETEDGEVEIQLEDESQRLDDIVENNIKKETLIKAIKSLPAEQRALIVLRDIRQFKYMEIAEMLKLNLGTIKSKISRARQALKAILEEDGTIIDYDESNV